MQQFFGWVKIKLLNTQGYSYIGCYPYGKSWDTLGNGLDLDMTINIPYSSLYKISDDNYMITFNANMTIEKCFKLCISNKFIFTGLNFGYINN